MDWPTPGVDPGVDDETGFIGHELGPLLQADHLLQTEILDFDSNYSKGAIPETILSDSAASSYTSGTAWHGYSGAPSAIQSLLQAFPAKTNYLTEHAGNPGEQPATVVLPPRTAITVPASTAVSSGRSSRL